MPSRFRLYLGVCFVAFVCGLFAAPKEFKDNTGNGKGSDKGNFDDGTGSAPGNDDTVKIAHGKKATLDTSTTWGAIDFSGGTIDGANPLTLTGGTTGLASTWTGGDIEGATITSNATMTIASGGTDAKHLKSNGKLTLAGATAWTGDAIGVADASELTNTGTFTTNFDGTVTHDGGTRGTFKNQGAFIKAGGTGASGTEIQTAFDNTATGASVQVSSGTLKLTGGGNSSRAVTLDAGTKLQIASNDFTFSGGALNATGTGAIEVAGAVATFSGTSGSANLTVNGTGTAKIGSSHSTTGKLTLSSGKIDGTTNTSTATVGGFDWTGGDISTAVINSSGTTIGAGGTKNLSNGAKLNLANSTTWSADAINASGSAAITNNGTFNTGFDGTLANGGAATFINAGTFEKTAGTSAGTTIAAKFDSSGTIKTTGGSLKLTGGGKSTGAVSVGSGTTLEISSTDYAFETGALTGVGTIELKGATTTFKNTTGSANVKVNGSAAKATIDTAFTTSGTLSLTAGTIDGAGLATVGSLDFTGGTLNGTVVANGGGIGNGGAKNLGGSARLTFGGNSAWDGSTVTTTQGATIETAAGKTLTVADGSILNDGSSIRATFTNAGTLQKSNGSGTTEIQAKFDSSGSITVDDNKGTLKLTGGGKSTGGVSLGAGTMLQVGTTDYAFESGALTGTGTIELTGATTTFKNTTGSANVKVNGNSAKATIDAAFTTSGQLGLAAGTLEGTGAATVGSLAWTGGTLNGAVSTAGGNIGAGGAKNLGSNGKLTLTGNSAWDGSTISTAQGALIENAAGRTLSAADGSILTDGIGPRATFTNAGNFKKSAGSGTTEIQTRFDSTGAITVDDNKGTLKLTGGGRSTGNVSLGASTTLAIGTTDYAFESGALDGAGTIELKGSTTTFKNTTGSANVKVNGSTAKATIDTAFTTTGKLSLAAGGIDGAGTATVGSLEWTGGSLDGKVTANGGTISAGGAKNLGSNGQLKLSGNTTWDGSTLSTTAGATIENDPNQTLTLADGSIVHDGGATRATFTNAGQLKKANGSGTTEIQTTLDSSGSITVDDNKGRLKLSGGGRSTGHVSVGADANLEIAGTDYTFESGALDGAGTIDLSAAVTTTLKNTTGSAKLKVNGGTVRVDGTHNGSGKLSLESGKVAGATTSSLATVGTLDWFGGEIATNVASTGNTNISPGQLKKITGGKLTLGGATMWNGGAIDTSDSGTIENNATFTTNFDGAITHGNGNRGTFQNNGTFNKTDGGAGETEIQTMFENNGTVNVSVGKLKLSGTGKNGKNAKIEVAALAELDIASDLELLADSELKGNGLAKLLGGTLTANGKVGVKHFAFEAGGLSGSNTFDGTIDWNGGHWNNGAAGAVTTIDVGGILNLGNGADHEFNNRSLINRGTINWQSGNLRGGNGSEIRNEANAIFYDLNEGNKTLKSPGNFGGNASFTNNGRYQKTSAGNTTIEVAFTNNSELLVNAGTLRFADTFTQTAGQLFVAANATVKFDQGLNFGAGTLGGSGTIEGNVTNSGKLSPGSSPGAMTITGNLTLASASVAFFEIGGTAQGTTYDFVNVSGAATLGGLLQFGFTNNFHTTALVTDTFTILTAPGGLTGAFANVANGERLAALDGLGSFQVNYGPGSVFATNSLVLSNFSSVPEPSTWALMLSGLGFMGYALRRKKKP